MSENKNKNKLVLFVGLESWGTTVEVAKQVSAFARVQLAVRRDDVLNSYGVFERVWRLDDQDMEKPDLVYTLREGYVDDAVVVGARLGVPFHGINDPKVVSDKFAVHEALAAAQIGVPETFYVLTFESLLRSCDQLLNRGFDEAILKPRNAGGSAAVTKIDRRSMASSRALKICWNSYVSRLKSLASRHSLPRLDSKGALLQGYVGDPYTPGQLDPAEFAVEVFCDGRYAETIQIHEKWHMRNREPFCEPVFVAPLCRGVQFAEELDETARRVTSILGLSRGLAHVEMRLRDGKLIVLDVGARGGGGLVRSAVQCSRGFDYQTEAIRALLTTCRTWTSINWGAPSNVQAVALLTFGAEEVVDGAVLVKGVEAVKLLPTFKEILKYHDESFAIVDPAVDLFAEVVLSGVTAEVTRDVELARSCLQIVRVHDIPQARKPRTWLVAIFQLCLIVIGFSSFFPRTPASGLLVVSEYANSVQLGALVALFMLVALLGLADEVRTWSFSTKNVMAMGVLLATGWAGARAIENLTQNREAANAATALAAENRKPIFVFSSTPELSYAGPDSATPKITIRLRARNEGKTEIKMPFSRTCLFGSRRAIWKQNSAPVCDYIVLGQGRIGRGFRSASEAEAVRSPTRFLCRQTETEYPYICVRPFSQSTGIDPGETITADFALDTDWLRSLGRMIYVQSVALYTPDDGGIECTFDWSSETVFDIKHKKSSGPNVRGNELCWQRSENHLIRNPLADMPAGTAIKKYPMRGK